MSNTATKYLSCAETAVLIRKTLKAQFPGVKFSVRSSTYSMGASVHVSWTGYPSSERVNKVVGQFEGKAFDGMIDMATYITRWLLPDGTMTLAHTPGTTGSRGIIPPAQADAPCDGAIMVHSGADYVLTQREVGDDEMHLTADDGDRYSVRTICRTTVSPEHGTRDCDPTRINCTDCLEWLAEQERWQAEYKANALAAS